jgi:hypothetical protein
MHFAYSSNDLHEGGLRKKSFPTWNGTKGDANGWLSL